jgi:hypothetical protein
MLGNNELTPPPLSPPQKKTSRKFDTVEIFGAGIRVAKFFVVHHTKIGNYIPNEHNIYQIAMVM